MKQPRLELTLTLSLPQGEGLSTILWEKKLILPAKVALSKKEWAENQRFGELIGTYLTKQGVMVQRSPSSQNKQEK